MGEDVNHVTMVDIQFWEVILQIDYWSICLVMSKVLNWWVQILQVCITRCILILADLLLCPDDCSHRWIKYKTSLLFISSAFYKVSIFVCLMKWLCIAPIATITIDIYFWNYSDYSIDRVCYLHLYFIFMLLLGLNQ